MALSGWTTERLYSADGKHSNFEGHVMICHVWGKAMLMLLLLVMLHCGFTYSSDVSFAATILEELAWHPRNTVTAFRISHLSTSSHHATEIESSQKNKTKPFMQCNFFWIFVVVQSFLSFSRYPKIQNPSVRSTMVISGMPCNGTPP